MKAPACTAASEFHYQYGSIVSKPSEQDLQYLRHAIRLSENARISGNRPFGAVLVAAGGEVIGTGQTRAATDGDLTSHAETNALREASKRVSTGEIARATMYASGEPCPMCAGAIVQLGLRRVVFGVRWQVNRPFMAPPSAQMKPSVSCRDIFRLAPEPIEVIGPLLEDEAKVPFEAYAARGSK